MTTGLIAYRILRTRMALHKGNSGNSRVYSALVFSKLAVCWQSSWSLGIQIVFLESAAIYSTSLLVLMIVYVLNSNSQYILLDVVRNALILKMFMLTLVPDNVIDSSLRSIHWGVDLQNAFFQGITFSMILLRLVIIDLKPEQETFGSVRSAQPWGQNSHPLTSITVSRLVEVGTESFDHGDSAKRRVEWSLTSLIPGVVQSSSTTVVVRRSLTLTFFQRFNVCNLLL